MAGVVTRQQWAPAEYNGIEAHQFGYLPRAPRAPAASRYVPPVFDVRQVAVLWLVGTVYGKAIAEQPALMSNPLGSFLNESVRMATIKRHGFDFPGRAIDCYYGHVS